MNFHIFVLISTFVFYIILRLYKSDVQKRKDVRKTSNFIYVLFVPLLLYLLNFMYKIKEHPLPNQSYSELSDVSEQSLLSIPYPESTVN